MNLADRAALLLGVPVAQQSPVAGGDLSQVLAVDFDDGSVAIVKSGPRPEVEAKMLRAIRATGAAAPAVLACDESILVIERLPSYGRLEDAWQDLGVQLSRLHRLHATDRCASRYGWDDDYAFAAFAIENTWSNDWPSFWASRRLLPHARFVEAGLAARLERLAARLAEFLPARPDASLLHGDLWGGNVVVAGSSISGLIDPACYYGDREVDFAMLSMFNRPESDLFAVCPQLAQGHEARLPIYQLWPALVHLRLFGASYRSLVESLLAATGF